MAFERASEDSVKEPVDSIDVESEGAYMLLANTVPAEKNLVNVDAAVADVWRVRVLKTIFVLIE